MAKDDKPQDLMRYDVLEQEARRSIVRAALTRAASPQGLPGDHHFYISFRTDAPGVSGPADLLGKYPDEMTIVLQHQYWDLAPGETSFSVALKFGGQSKKLTVPYASVTRFFDPSVQYLLQFAPIEGVVEARPATPKPAKPTALRPAAAKPAAEKAGAKAQAEPKIVSLDQFRKK